jgi:two-component system sensor histidine kinase/response regulator
LTNLVGNAIKFTNHGEIVITVKLITKKSNYGDELILHCQISDTGTGIPADKKEVLF